MLPKHIHRWPFADHAGKHLLIRTHSGKLSLRLSGSPTEVAILSLAPVSLLGLVLGTQEEPNGRIHFAPAAVSIPHTTASDGIITHCCVSFSQSWWHSRFVPPCFLAGSQSPLQLLHANSNLLCAATLFKQAG